jgi:hypothetical protein
MDMNNIRDVPAEERWPELNKVIKPELIFAHMADWIEDHLAANTTPMQFRNEVHRYYREALKAIPRAELEDSLAEHISATVVDCLGKHAQKLKGN